jgi:hypothetical protein
MKSSFHSLIHFLPLFCSCHFRRLDSIQFLISRQAVVPKLYSSLPATLIRLVASKSESELLYDWRFPANQFVLATSPLRLTTSNFIFQLNPCGHNPYITSSLTRGWVCRLQLLLVLASEVILRSESRGTHDAVSKI